MNPTSSTMADEEFTPPSLARTTSSRSFKSKKGLKKGSQTSTPVDVVFDTFEVFFHQLGARGGKVARKESALACVTAGSTIVS
jgi:hypothetical protein